MLGTVHEDLCTFYCCWRHEIAMKWYLAVSITEEVQILRERATILRYGTLLVLKLFH
jgi:hypothetical protein